MVYVTSDFSRSPSAYLSSPFYLPSPTLPSIPTHCSLYPESNPRESLFPEPPFSFLHSQLPRWISLGSEEKDFKILRGKGFKNLFTSWTSQMGRYVEKLVNYLVCIISFVSIHSTLLWGLYLPNASYPYQSLNHFPYFLMVWESPGWSWMRQAEFWLIPKAIPPRKAWCPHPLICTDATCATRPQVSGGHIILE